MKKILTAFIISLYAIQAIAIVFFWTSADYPRMAAILIRALPLSIFLNIVLGAITVLILLTRIPSIRKDIQKQSVFNNMTLTVKLLVIPFFTINFLIWVLATTSFIVIPGFQVFLPSIGLGVMFAYFVLLITSSASIIGLGIQFINNRIPFKKLAIHTILQLIFIVDVIDYIYLYFVIRKACRGLYIDEVSGKGYVDGILNTIQDAATEEVRE